MNRGDAVMTEPDEALLWAREQAKQLREAPNDPTRDLSAEIDAGKHDDELSDTAHAYRAGARMAREQERERAKGLVDNLANLVWRVGADWAQDDVTGINASEMISARAILAKYRGET